MVVTIVGFVCLLLTHPSIPCNITTLFLQREGRGDKSVGVRSSYLRAVGLTAEEGVTGGLKPFTAEEEEQFRRLAASPDVYERISMSIAPSVFGATDMKKAIACLLFGGMFCKKFNVVLKMYKERNILSQDLP